MGVQSDHRNPFTLNGFLVDPARLRIRRPDAVEVRLSPKAMHVLLVLAEGRGDVIKKYDLMDAVWGRAEVTDGVLSQTILEIRSAFGDDARNPHFVETIRGVGFRLIPTEVAATDHAANPRGRKSAWLVLPLLMFGAFAWYVVSLRDDAGVVANPRIVVVPFADRTPGGDHTYFAEGIADQIALHIAGNKNLTLLSSRALTELLDRGSSVGEAAAHLEADLLLTGSVRHEAESLTLIAHLTDARRNEELWVTRLNRPMAEIFAMQEEVARSLVSMIQRGQELPQRRVPTQNLAAYDLYLRGREKQRRLTEEDLTQAAEFFEQSLNIDPNFALARASLAETLAVHGFIVETNNSLLERAQREAEIALLAEPQIPEGLYAQALALMGTGRFALARLKASAAVAAAPNNPDVRFLSASLADTRGELVAAAKEYEIAFRLDPLLPRTVALGRLYHLLGEPDHGLRVAERGHDLEQGYATLYLAHLLTLTGDLERAANFCQIALDMKLPRSRNLCGFAALVAGSAEQARILLAASWEANPRPQSGPFTFAASATHLALVTDPERSRALLDESEAVTRNAIADGNDHWALRYNMAAIASQQGQVEKAGEWMALAFQEGFRDWLLLDVDPALAEFRRDPACRELLQRITSDLHRQKNSAARG